MEAKHGNYVIWRDREYYVWRVFRNTNEIQEAKKSRNVFYRNKNIIPGTLFIASFNKIDLLKGFDVFQDDEYGFVCLKNLKLSDVSKAYSYTSYALYDKIRCKVNGPNGKGYFFLETYDDVSVTEESDVLTKLQRCGFKRGYMMGHGMFIFEKYVSPDDPDLQIFEERTEIDVYSL